MLVAARGASGKNAVEGASVPNATDVIQTILNPKASSGSIEKATSTLKSGEYIIKQDTAISQTPGVAFIVKKLRDALASKGARGIFGLARKFRIMDDDESASLNQAEFRKGIMELGLGMNDDDIRLLFKYFDTDGGGTIDYNEFLRFVVGDMN